MTYQVDLCGFDELDVPVGHLFLIVHKQRDALPEVKYGR
jgi:hypothetical protein